MKDFKTYLKDKLKKQVNIVGKAELTPPPTTDVLQSSSALAVIDMLGEGPIEGLVTKDGRYAKGLKLFESFYLNKTPVKQQKLDTPTTKNIPFSAIKNVDRLSSTSINQSLDNIANRLSGEIGDFTNYTGNSDVFSYYNKGFFYRETDESFEHADRLDTVNKLRNPLTGTFVESGFTEMISSDRRQNTLDNSHSLALVGLFRPQFTDNYQFRLFSDDGSYMFLGPAIEENSKAKIDFFFDPGHGTSRATANVSFASKNTDGDDVTFTSDADGFTGRSRSGIMIRNGEPQSTTARHGQTGLESGRLYPVLILTNNAGGGDQDIGVLFRRAAASVDPASSVGQYSYNTGVHGAFLYPEESQDETFGTTISQDNATGDIFSLVGKNKYGIPLGKNPFSLTETKIDEIQEFKSEFTNFISQNSGLERFGFAEYDITDIFTATDLISGRISWQDARPNLVTVFDFENFLSQESGAITDTPIKRQLKIENNDTIKIPDDIHFCAPIFSSGQYGTLPGDSVGKVQNLTKVDHFGGGGIFFFEIGDTDAEVGDKFNTGKFFVSTSEDVTDITGAITSGITGNYDVFVYDSNAISLESATSTQITPVKGLTDGSNVKVGFISDLFSTYNYSNVALSFRNGYEQQPVLDGHSKSKQDFVAKQSLIGPLAYGGSATGTTADGVNDPAATGVGVGGYSDVRNAGDFSAWMTNPPLEHDFYAYTHIVRRSEVDRVEPSISIDGLSDTIAVGDDAGVQRPASIAIGITYGFEGDVGKSGEIGNDEDITPSVGQLLSGGNSIKSIALGQYKKTLNKIYTSIIQSSYMTTITEVDDLPVNENLKNAKVDQATIPGLTDALVTEFNLTSGQELFPGNSWKDVNRYMRIQKLSHETDSTLLTREVSVSYFTEIINQNFTFPYAALGASIFDARNFAQQPSREFDVRLKKVLIPSNYEPLNTDGSDKRFVESSKRYGLRSIFKFDGTAGAGNRSTNAGLATKSIKLGPHNFEISLKIKFGDVSSKRNLSYYLLDMLSKDSGSSLLNDDRLGLIQRGKSDGGDGSTTTNPQLVLFSPNEGDTVIDIPAGLSTSIVYQIKIKRVGDNLTLSMHNYETGELIGESTDTGYGNDSINYDVMSEKRLAIGQAFNLGSKVSAGSQIADVIIKKNGEITNWWDGTIINTVRGGLALKDKVGGSHADLANTPGNAGSVVEDTNFQFGKNKEILYNGHWDGTFKLGWTDNPAWILYDLMINPIYGIGNHIDDREDVNVFKLFEIARYCDAVDADGLFDGVPDSTLGLEPRFSANIRLSEPKNAYEVIGNIASIFRAISFWDGSSLTFNSDRPKPISALFNNGNVYDGTFNYADISSAARFTRVEVPYSDAKDEFALKFEYVEDEERIRKYGVIVSKVNGIGCTSKSQARRMGKYVMLSNKMETELVNFEVGNEACLLEPGDIIRIDDEVKQFEINYGKILEIETGTPGTKSPYLIVEDTINTGSIITGDSFGGLYTYSNEPQKELSTLYDISNFNAKLTFGTDNNVITGKIPIETIEGSDKPPVSKFYITGINGSDIVDNGIKLFINSGDSNFKTITGVRQGQFFNIELDTQVTGEYKIVSIKPTENNLFKIDALQYERRKFDKIEAEDFDVEENTYNIGIPLHTVNRPSAPTFNFEIFQTSNLSYSITGDINGAGGSNETKYRVTLLKTNLASPYVQKEFLKDTSDSSDGAGTPFRINNIVDGNYTVRVTALRNPESSPSIEKTFSIKPPTVQYIKPLIYKINGDLNISQMREHGTGYGEVQSLSNDCDYNIDICDIYGRSVNVKESDLSINVYAKTGENYNLIKENYKENQYTFTEVQNRLTYGQMNTGFQLRFDLIQNEQTVDTSYYNTTII